MKVSLCFLISEELSVVKPGTKLVLEFHELTTVYKDCHKEALTSNL